MNGKIILKYILMIVMMIDIATSTCSAISGPQKTIDAEEFNGLKILTWNIYMLPFCSIVHGNCKRARAIASKLATSNYDIIVFEEAFDPRARNILRRKLREKYPHMYGPVNKLFFSFRTNSGLWILSKIPLHKLKEIEYKYRYGIDAMARKGAVLFEGEWLGHTFQLAATHLQADSPDSVRHEQCTEISDKLLKKFARINVPQIVCGDFNIEMQDTKNYQFMLKTLDVLNGDLEGDIHTTFDEVDNKLAKTENGKKQVIDYVLIRNIKFIKEVRRRVAVIKGIRNNLSFDLSDHYGMEANINFGTNSGLSTLFYSPKTN